MNRTSGSFTWWAFFGICPTARVIVILGVLAILTAPTVALAAEATPIRKGRRTASVAPADARLSGDAFAREARYLAKAQDDLGLRVLFRRFLPAQLNFRQWRSARAALHSRPGSGWDVLRALDFGRLVGPAALPVERTIAAADQASSARDFVKAAQLYEASLRLLSSSKPRFGSPNYLLYQTVLHSYGRALYGAGRHRDSLVVYSWISPIYPHFRQVLFEKMWAGFRSELYGHALGAIASQRSARFSRRLEPESYLIQYYLFRRLCRTSEVDRVKAEAKSFAEALANGGFGPDEWARGDVETLLLSRLARSPESSGEPSTVVTDRARAEEVAWIRKSLKERYDRDLPRLKDQMDKVVAYFNLAMEAGKKELPPLSGIQGVKQVLNSDQEMWPASDAEEWLDELGRHVFVGQSECRFKAGS